MTHNVLNLLQLCVSFFLSTFKRFTVIILYVYLCMCVLLVVCVCVLSQSTRTGSQFHTDWKLRCDDIHLYHIGRTQHIHFQIVFFNELSCAHFFLPFFVFARFFLLLSPRNNCKNSKLYYCKLSAFHRFTHLNFSDIVNFFFKIFNFLSLLVGF